VTTSAVPVSVVDSGVGRRPPELEVALYFCCIEAVQNAVKHASATHIEVRLDATHDRVRLTVSDDGTGLDPVAVLSAGGLGNLRDRADSVGGELEVRTNDSGGTDVVVSVPVDASAEVA
jgi:signal transduction histidine kinase